MVARGAAPLGATLLAGALIGAAAAASPAERPLRLDDLRARQSLSLAKDWSIARDGALAFAVERAANTRRSWFVPGADVWVQLAAHRAPVDVTQGSADGSDWRVPLWSPDGTKLLLQSTRGGVRSLWIWERAGGALRRVTDRALASETAVYDWVDDAQVLAVVLPAGVAADPAEAPGGEAMRAAREAWDRYLAGESTASVLQTGQALEPQSSGTSAATPLASNEWRQLVSIDIAARTQRIVMDRYRPASFELFTARLSPDRRNVTVPVQWPALADAPYPLDGTMRLELRRLDGASPLPAPLPGDVLWQSARWSPDGAQLAFLAFGASRVQPPRLVRVDVRSGRVRQQHLGELVVAQLRDDDWDFARLEWTESGAIVCRGALAGQARVKFARRDWWLVPAAGAPRKITARLRTVPDFARYSRAGPLLGIADGVLWKVDADGAAVRPLLPRGDFPIAKIAWPATDNERMRWAIGRTHLIEREERPFDGSIVVSSTGPDGGIRYAKVQTSTGRLLPLSPPAPDAQLARLDPAGEHVFWVDDAFSAASLWRDRERVLVLNAWTADIIVPPDMHIEYTSHDGESYRGWLQLPVGYRPGRRYPTIVRVYPGKTGEPQRSDADFRLAAAAGFAVLWPQMGTENGRQFNMKTRDLFFEVANGVLPAVERAIELGFADGERLFVEGWSGGGFAAYALIEQSSRFRAALAGAGISDWTNGSFFSSGRYTAQLARLGIGWMGENLQDRPAVETPWSDLGLFLRNSPIQYAHRVRTPLLIVHGDQDDNVAMSHAEEMFAAMVQLEKRAAFVRYWGEGHGMLNPANVRDLWQRRLAWFDEFGDILRDERGHMVFEGDQVKSRGAAAPLPASAYAGFEFFQRGGAAGR